MRLAMTSISPRILAVFAHFQNLNLLALMQDLREGRTARHAWLAGSFLCPVAHGLPRGEQVLALRASGQVDDLGTGCDFAARQLGAKPDDVYYFVLSWDDSTLGAGQLLRELEQIWLERLTDAEAVQDVLQGGSDAEDEFGERGDGDAIARTS
jgi:hypothetical protein